MDALKCIIADPYKIQIAEYVPYKCINFPWYLLKNHCSFFNKELRQIKISFISFLLATLRVAPMPVHFLNKLRTKMSYSFISIGSHIPEL